MRLPRLAPVVIACLLVASPAHALFIDLGNGMIYDTVQDITWVQDAALARTSGAHPDGRFTYAGARAWVESLTFGGYDDWRLPRMRTRALHSGSNTEVSTMMAELGGYWSPPYEGNQFPSDYNAPRNTAPFINMSFLLWLDPPAGTTPCTEATLGGCFVWMSQGEIDFSAHHWDWDEASPNAWAVRDGGNPEARVPEPSTLLLIGLGAVLLRRRRLPRRQHQSFRH